MKTIALLLVISAVASGIEWTNLYAKWNTWLLDPFRSNSFFDIPRTLDDAISASWTEVTGLNNLGLTTYCYPNDGQLCILFDLYGYIAGFQACLLASDLDPMGDLYPTSAFDVYANKTINEEKYVCSTVYTQDPSTLPTGRSSEWDSLTGVEGVWFETTSGYTTVPRNVAEFDPLWIEEACIGSMGTHYYYDMSPTTECKNFFPWFLMVQDGELTGLGLQAFGSCTIKDRSWCEWVPAVAIRPTIPTTSQCVVDWADEYGVISIHLYFTAEPWNIAC